MIVAKAMLVVSKAMPNFKQERGEQDSYINCKQGLEPQWLAGIIYQGGVTRSRTYSKYHL